MMISCLCSFTAQKIPRPKGLAASFLVDIPSCWEPLWPYGLHLLIFPQPLGRALKNQNAAPTTPHCFCRRLRSSLLLFESCTVHRQTVVIPVDIPSRWEPRAKQQPTGLIAYGTSCRRPVRVLYRPPQKNPQTEWSGDCGGALSTALEPNTSSRVTVLASSVKLKLSTTRSSKT